MVDLRWMLATGLAYALRKVTRHNGKFVFAVVGRTTDTGIEVVVSDTTAVPAGPAVKSLVDSVVHAHSEAVMRVALKHPDIPVTIREMLNELLEKSPEATVDPRLPARSWKSDEVGQA